MTRFFPLMAVVSLLFFGFDIEHKAHVAPETAYSWQEPENHALYVDRLVKYHDFGEYDREIREVANSARDYVETVTENNPKNEKLAAVFDIDETALSNWGAMNACGFCSYPAQQELNATNDPVYSLENDPAIVPVLELFQFAQKKGIAVFFVTGRPESQRQLTKTNLMKVGYVNWSDDKLYMRQTNEAKDAASVLKPRKRQDITDKGYRIVLNIGDQASDLAGCCAERVFKIPNPFYLVK